MSIENPEFISKNIKVPLNLDTLETIILTNFLNNQTLEHKEITEKLSGINPIISNKLYELSNNIQTSKMKIGEYMDKNIAKLRILYNEIDNYHNSVQIMNFI